jgi:hypothetical protein
LTNEKIENHNCLHKIQGHPLNEHLQLFVHQVIIQKIDDRFSEMNVWK